MKSIALLVLAAAAAWAQRPEARSLIERHIRETGGASAAAPASSQILRGRFAILNAGIAGTTTIYSDGEGRSYQVMEAKGIGKIEHGNSGDIEWERSTVTGPRVVRVGHTRGSLLRPPLTETTHWMRDLPVVQTIGEDAVDGKPCWQVEARAAKSGPPTRLCFDKASGLLAAASGRSSTGSSTFEIETKFADYRPFGGGKVPYRIEFGTGSNPMRLEIDEIQAGAAMPDGIFEEPEEIQELARRQITDIEIKEREEDPNRPRLRRKRK